MNFTGLMLKSLVTHGYGQHCYPSEVDLLSLHLLYRRISITSQSQNGLSSVGPNHLVVPLCKGEFTVAVRRGKTNMTTYTKVFIPSVARF